MYNYVGGHTFAKSVNSLSRGAARLTLSEQTMCADCPVDHIDKILTTFRGVTLKCGPMKIKSKPIALLYPKSTLRGE